MSTLQNKFIVYRGQYHANMTDQNNLGRLLAIKPEKIGPVMQRIFASTNLYNGNALSSYMMDAGITEKEITTTAWEWELQQPDVKKLVCMGNVEPTVNTTPGKFGRSFKLKLDDNHYLPGDNIHPGDKRQTVRIKTGPLKHGDGYIYEVVMASGNKKDYLDLKYLEFGVMWGKLYSNYGEGAEQSGSMQFGTKYSYASKMSLLRKHFAVTDLAHNEVLNVGLPVYNTDGTLKAVTKSWFYYAEAAFWQQFYREKDIAKVYGRSTDEPVIDSTGREVLAGPGLHEILEESNIHRTNHVTTNLFEEYLMDIYFSTTGPSIKTLPIFTGQVGMRKIHKAIDSLVDKKIVLDSKDVMSKTTSKYNTNSLKYGYQFTEFNMFNGTTLKVVHMPLYDDKNINWEINPLTGFPYESERMTFLNFDPNDKGESNIQVIKKKDAFSFGYVAGLVTPYGPVNNGLMSHAGAYYEMHASDMLGMQVTDLTKCGEILPNKQ